MRRPILIACLLSAAVSAIVTVLTFGVLRHWSDPDAAIVRARRYEVIDEEGKLRAYLGGPRFNDSLTLVDANGVERASLRVLAEGTSVFSMADGEGRGRVGIFVTRQGSATLQFYDRNGRVSGVVAGEPEIP